MSRIFDISLTITPTMPVWPGDPTIVLERVGKIEEGGNSNVSRLVASVHSGTHVDAPVHFLPGEKGVEALSLDVLLGPAQVVQIPGDVDKITSDILESCHINKDVQRVLLKTRNSRFWDEKLPMFHKDFVAISSDGAQYLVNQRIRLVGIDYLSIAPYRESRPTHEILLKAGIVLLEGLDLSKVPEGLYDLYCLPLKLGGSDGAPARAVLVQEE
jgi:arylformamidase